MISSLIGDSKIPDLAIFSRLSSAAGTDLLMSRILFMAAGIAGNCCDIPTELVECRVHAPETASCKSGLAFGVICLVLHIVFHGLSHHLGPGDLLRGREKSLQLADPQVDRLSAGWESPVRIGRQLRVEFYLLTFRTATPQTLP